MREVRSSFSGQPKQVVSPHIRDVHLLARKRKRYRFLNGLRTNMAEQIVAWILCWYRNEFRALSAESLVFENLHCSILPPSRPVQRSVPMVWKERSVECWGTAAKIRAIWKEAP